MATTAAQLIADAKEEADLTSSSFVGDAQWLRWINDGGRELHHLVSTTFRDTFYAEKDFTIASSSAYKYTLPTDFMRARGLDRDPTLPTRQTIHRFDFGERNSVGRWHHYSRFHRTLRYRVISRTTLLLEPREDAPGDYRLFYVKRFTEMTNSGTPVDLIDELAPWQAYISCYAAMKALDKRGLDTTGLKERRDLMRLDIEASAKTDENESDTVVDVEDEWDGWTTSASGSVEAE